MGEDAKRRTRGTWGRVSARSACDGQEIRIIEREEKCAATKKIGNTPD